MHRTVEDRLLYYYKRGRNVCRQNWKFLDKDAEFEGDIFNHRPQIEQDIHQLENQSIDEKIFEYYQSQLDKRKASSADDAATVNTTDTTTTTTTITQATLNMIPEESEPQIAELTEEDIFELNTSLNMLKMFYDERHKADSRIVMRTTQPSKVTDSPRAIAALAATAEGTGSKIRNKDELKDTLLASAPTYERKELTLLSVQASLERKLLKKMLNAELTAANNFNRAKISLTAAEKMRQRVTVVGEHLKLIEIAKCFKRYVEDKGSRMPHFLRKVDVNAQSVNMKDSEIKALLTQHRHSSVRPSMVNAINKANASGTLGHTGGNDVRSVSAKSFIASLNKNQSTANESAQVHKPGPVTTSSSIVSPRTEGTFSAAAIRAPEAPAPSKRPSQAHRKVSFSH
jgi:hypothetical protein